MRFLLWPVIIGVVTVIMMLFLHSRVISDLIYYDSAVLNNSTFPFGQYVLSFVVGLSEYYDSLVQDTSTGHNVILLSIIVFSVFFIYSLFILSRNTALLFNEKARSKTMFASIHDGVFVTDDKGIVEFINPSAERLLECDKDDVVGRPIEDVFKLVYSGSLMPVDNGVQRCIEDGEPYTFKRGNTSVITSNKNQVDVEYEVAPIKGRNDNVTGVVIVFEDVTHRRRIARELEWAATHDPLTGLVNRREFGNRIVEGLIAARLDKKSHTLLCMDLDKFKVVNDQGGHAAGDALLKRVVEEIKKVLRSSDVFARLGGDEFAVLLMYCPMKKAIHLSHEIIDAVKAINFEWEGRVFKIGVSIGVAEVNKNSKNDSHVLSLADEACYAAKEDGRNCVRAIGPDGVMLAGARKVGAKSNPVEADSLWY